MLQILDEEVHLPSTTDATLLAKLNATFGTEPGRAGGHPAYSTDFRRPALFTIAHYAGKVTYAHPDAMPHSSRSRCTLCVPPPADAVKALCARLLFTPPPADAVKAVYAFYVVRPSAR